MQLPALRWERSMLVGDDEPLFSIIYLPACQTSIFVLERFRKASIHPVYYVMLGGIPTRGLSRQKSLWCEIDFHKRHSSTGLFWLSAQRVHRAGQRVHAGEHGVRKSNSWTVSKE